MPGDDRSAELSVRDRIPGSEAAMVLELVRAATDEDDVRPLSEHVMLHLRYGGDPGARDLLLRSRGELPDTRTWIRPARAASW
jgi:mycothiol synthase